MYLKFIACFMLLANLPIFAFNAYSHSLPSSPEKGEHKLFVENKTAGKPREEIDAIITISVLSWKSDSPKSLVIVNDKLGLSSRTFEIDAVPSVRTRGSVSNLCLTLTREQAKEAGLLA